MVDRQEKVIEYNGKVYTEEEIKEILFKATSVMSDFVEYINNVWDEVKESVKFMMKTDNVPVGYKRLFKDEQLKAYENSSEGKSNNWRKLHGLPLNRCR